MEPDFDLRRIGKRLLWLFTLLTVPYVLLCAVMTVQQRHLIYLPQYTRLSAAHTDFALPRDGLTLRGWRVGPGHGAVLLYFGGNAESLHALREPMARWLPSHTVYLVAYRGYGASDGEPSETALASDAIALFDHVRRHHPGQPIAVIGRSLGSGVATHLASQRPVQRLVLVTPFDSLLEVAAGHYPWLPVRWLLHDRYDSAGLLRDFRQPVLVIRADQDRVMPPARTDRLLASLPEAPQVLALPDTGHDFDLFGEATAVPLVTFLQPSQPSGNAD